MIKRLMRMNLRKGMQYLKGITSQPMTFVGAMYENSASDLTMEIVLTAKRN
jgi:hypothetical protein